MKSTNVLGVFKEGKKIFTRNPPGCEGEKVYGENLLVRDNVEYRSWDPNRSKLAAAILKKIDINFKSNFTVLYLGAATGTTVSHLSDILNKGLIYAIEISPVSMKKLIDNFKNRENVIPILEDAFHPEKYKSYVTKKTDVVYQDIAQKQQPEIFIKNVNKYLKKGGLGFFMVKARSIDVSSKPSNVYENIYKFLKKNNMEILTRTNLLPFEKDHELIITTKK
ncbi:MAG: fibrillarin-like rRNA/tRNA 2'-O-methyltransferase [Candidatus Thermoplasmatota archaeon]